jgi:RNA polymerase sigma-70 factor, ECF subfamily
LTLLERLRQPGDDAAWGRFVELYTPLLFAWARRCGASEHDAADLVQEVFVILVQTLPSFDCDRQARFRGWLRTLLLNKLRDRKRRQARAGKAMAELAQERRPAGQRGAVLGDGLPERAGPACPGADPGRVHREYMEVLLGNRGARPRPAEVARALGISENAVYIARCRVLRRLRQELGGLVE